MTMTAAVWTPMAAPGTTSSPAGTAGEETREERVELGHTVLRNVNRYLLEVHS
jgi:hypothetical protein